MMIPCSLYGWALIVSLAFSRKSHPTGLQFLRLCLQDMIDRDHLGLIVEIENAA